mgnify:CR=1 FL=1
MTEYAEGVFNYYQNHLQNGLLEKTIYTADCPFCPDKSLDGTKRLVVFINPEGFFHGYFRCLNRCVPGGFPLWFASLLKVERETVPGYDSEREPLLQQNGFSGDSINKEIKNYHDSMTDAIIQRFSEAGIGGGVLKEMSIGFNGRYIVYPYFQVDGNCYSARCVFPDRPEDSFWHGNEAVVKDEYQIFNVQDIARCENGTLAICEGEDNLLTLKQLGLPGVAVPDSHVFETIDPEIFSHLKTIFISASNNGESEVRARALASRIGYKVRLLRWSSGQDRNYNLWQLAKDKGKEFSVAVTGMARDSKAFSPFSSPRFEHDQYFSRLKKQSSTAYADLFSGFTALDNAIEGVHGINVFGGAPKVGKSCFMIQIGTEMALRSIPVIYYDFENGKQKIYQRTMVRLSSVTSNRILGEELSLEEQQRYDTATKKFKKMLNWFRVVNDRRVTPEIMRRHIDFIRHETGSDYTVVIIDSLHKLPFKDFSERRTGIDAWLRQLESIRDEMQVSFLVISELSRGEKGSYRETPHMGVFKGSGDIEYSADNALVMFPNWDQQTVAEGDQRTSNLWLVASREHSPGLVATYQLNYPYWGFRELLKKS